VRIIIDAITVFEFFLNINWFSLINKLVRSTMFFKQTRFMKKLKENHTVNI